MKNLLKIEEFAMFAICAYGLYWLKVDWWYYLILLIGPDISMMGYMAGNKAGATLYNLFHHKGIAVIVFGIGVIVPVADAQVIGIILFGHASLDRIFSYGLKLNNGFKHTHLGMIGK